MSSESAEKVQKMHPDEVLSFVREHEDPGVTAGEVAEAFGVTRRAARYRLDQLADRDDVYGKTVGASAKIWFPKG
ncbi:helix-turn-helix domain-containing protein [Halobellus ordinarius]|uniref:helix-turn-helix domain-containing protein n=1 Tax=Halobellus ordinarius TaxID=3075120 RepID=UPI00288058F2|nr:HTH domain-containing protein [Halobellus sp. ZY16]